MGVKFEAAATSLLSSMDREGVDSDVHSPSTDSLQALTEIVGERDRAKGVGGVVVFLPGFGEEDHCGFPPWAGGVVEKNGGFIYVGKGFKNIGGKIGKDFRAETIRSRRFLIFEGDQCPADEFRVDPVGIEGV